MAERKREEVIITKDNSSFDDDVNLARNAKGLDAKYDNDLSGIATDGGADGHLIQTLDQERVGRVANSPFAGKSYPILCSSDNGDLWSPYYANFGRDANRLDYFIVSPFDVNYGDDDLNGIDSYGGGGGGDSAIQASHNISYNDASGSGVNVRRHQQVVQRMDQESAGAGAAATSFPGTTESRNSKCWSWNWWSKDERGNDQQVSWC